MFTEDYKKTIGVDFLEKLQWVPGLGEEVRLLVWDTAGQEEFDAITKAYYRGGRAWVARICLGGCEGAHARVYLAGEVEGSIREVHGRAHRRSHMLLQLKQVVVHRL